MLLCENIFTWRITFYTPANVILRQIGSEQGTKPVAKKTYLLLQILVLQQYNTWNGSRGSDFR